MKIGVFGDLHLTNKTPKRRKDDYPEACKRKIIQATEFFKSRGCKYVVQPGDFYDSPTVAKKVESETIRLFKSLGYGEELKLYCCYGQHDISGHSKSTLPNTPLAVTESAGVLHIVDEEPNHVNDTHIPPFRNVYVYGASFGQDIPKVKNSEDFNILLTHRMVGNRQLWPTQPLENPRKLLRNHPDYNLIICGDYHYAFQDGLKDQLILNPGLLARRTKNDVNFGHEPGVCIVDTETLKVEWLKFDVTPSEELFDLTADKVIDKGALNRFVQNLKDSKKDKGKRTLWKKTLCKVIAEKVPSKGALHEIEVAEEELNLASTERV